MSNTARLAREWADTRNPDTLTEVARAAREHILATTDPLTMADTLWDEEEHALAGATVDLDGKLLDVAMLDKDVDSFITYATLDGEVDYVAGSAVTPNGKRYELREVGAPEQPAHPATLETLEDFQNAPDGTVISYAGNMPLTLIGEIWRRGFATQTHKEMAGDKCPVLRWGWGE